MGQKFSQKGSNAKETQVGERGHPPTLYESRKELFPLPWKVGKGKERVNRGEGVYYNPTSREVGLKCRGEFSPFLYRNIKRSTGSSFSIVLHLDNGIQNLRLHALSRCLSDSTFFFLPFTDEVDNTYVNFEVNI